MKAHACPIGPVREMPDWSPGSWKKYPQSQQPAYDDSGELQTALASLSGFPPLVTSWEIFALRHLLAEAAEGRRFLLQGGDCAETFEECTSPVISNRLKVLLQMSLVLVHGLKMPVVRMGRFAGQYAKPRSCDSETHNGVTLPTYRGDLVNGAAFTEAARRADPQRLIGGYAHSAMTLNFVRALIDGGFADLHHPEYWDLAWVDHSPLQSEYRQMVDSIGNSMRFMETLADEPIGSYRRVDFYTSHEALVLHYEQALTRQVPRQWGWFDLSTHFPWIGMRTADLDGAHVEFCRGIRNPIGVKIGPETAPDRLLRLIEVLDPDNEPGRLVLIHRMGAGHIEAKLPPLLNAVRSAGRRVLWTCDPHRSRRQWCQDPALRQYPRRARSRVRRACRLRYASWRRSPGTHG